MASNTNNVNLNITSLWRPNAPIETATVVGEDELFATIQDLPPTLKYPGKVVYDKDNDIEYLFDKDNNAVPKPKIYFNTEVPDNSFGNNGDIVFVETDSPEGTYPSVVARLDEHADAIDEVFDRTANIADFDSIADAITANLAGTFSLQKDSSTKVETAISRDFTTKGITIQGDNSELWTDGTDMIFSFNVTPARTVRITAIDDDVNNIGDPLMSKITTQFSHNCSVGDVVFITGTTDANLDEIDPKLTRKGDCSTVYKVISATEILVTRLANTYDLTAQVNLNKPDTARINIRNVNFYRTIFDLLGVTTHLVEITRAFRPVMENINIVTVNGRGLTFESCFSPEVRRLYVAYADDELHGSDGKSYGVFVHGSVHGIFDNIIAHNTRHVIDLQGNKSKFAGYASFNLITNSIGFNNTSGAFSTHQGAHWNTFLNCKSYQSRQGFNVRGWGNIYDSCKSIRDYIGFQIINDQGTDPLPWPTKTGNILIKNTDIINPVAYAIRINADPEISDITIRNSTILSEIKSFSLYVMTIESSGCDVYIQDLTIDIYSEVSMTKFFELINDIELYIDKLTIRIGSTAVMPATYSIFNVTESCKIEINTLDVIVDDAATLPTHLFNVSAGKTVTGFVRNVYMSGIKAGGKLHSLLADDQTFVNDYSHGAFQIGATTLIPE